MLGVPYHISEVAQACGALDLYQGRWKPDPVRYIAYDSRRISFGAQTIFVALQNGHRDGHAFIQDAYDKGVRSFVVSSTIDLPDIDYVLVDDSLDALQRWAMTHRQRFNYPVLAITGSNGKTTVKEWLATVLELEFQIVKSPGSYNSQLGVALSLLQMHPEADLAIIEAGISQSGEMARLEAMIAPTFGILTHMGPAHEDGFDSFEEKLAEKMSLFERCEWVLGGNAATAVETQDFASLQHIPVTGPAAQENGRLVADAAHKLGMTWEAIAERMLLIHPVDMRTEIITDNPDLTIVNDSYNTDPDSIRNAFALLTSIKAHDEKVLVLGDIPHLGEKQLSVQKALLDEAISLFGTDNIITLGPVFGSIHMGQHYADTASLIANFDYSFFQHKTVLLKAARNANLERLLPLLNRHPNATYMRIDLDALEQNYRTLRTPLPDQVKVMAMVKAFSYGSGSWEIASALETAGVEYLSVAYASEGIHLRDRGIQLPIMVNNPDRSSLSSLVQYALEPLIFDMAGLRSYLRAARLSDLRHYRCHLKFDTGMGRLGFVEKDLEAIIPFLAAHPDLEVMSVMTHLAAADEPSEDTFTHHQVARFQNIYNQLHDRLGIQPLRHVVNTAGTIRFPAYAFDMLRLGIGLYGIASAPDREIQLEEIASLRSHISQIHHYPAGTSIGYGRAQYTECDARIATVPIGYADGILRALGEGNMHVLVRGQRVLTFGRICMDMLMIDVTDVDLAAAGDEVVLFGKQGDMAIAVSDMAEQAGTIAYEILSRISPRVRRVYVRE
ncbi:MAG: alanine racemase [Bacteroidia bacterium]